MHDHVQEPEDCKPSYEAAFGPPATEEMLLESVGKFGVARYVQDASALESTLSPMETYSTAAVVGLRPKRKPKEMVLMGRNEKGVVEYWPVSLSLASKCRMFIDVGSDLYQTYLTRLRRKDKWKQRLYELAVAVNVCHCVFFFLPFYKLTRV